MATEKKIKSIGYLKGEVLVFGGVYSNYQALQAIQEVASQRNIPAGNILCSGDVVAYCAQPGEVVNALMDWNIHCIAGNVEQNLVEGEDDCGCNFREGGRCDLFSRQWYPYAQSQLSPGHLRWMASLPDLLTFTYAGQKAMLLHGSLHNTSEFVFQSTPWQTKQAVFEETQCSLVIAGHSGIPFLQTEQGNTWLNAGVIGMPANDGTPRVWYALLNDEQGKLQASIYSLDYDHTTASLLMNDKPLPQTYAKTLLTGIWDNCEILPAQEAAAQGKALFSETVWPHSSEFSLSGKQ